MDSCSNLIQRIVSRSGVVRSTARRELERELAAHVEDAIENLRSRGYDETRVVETVSERFGDPDEIAREFSNVYRFDRALAAIGRSVALVMTSVLAVAGVILSFQLALAILSGGSPVRAFPHWREQSMGFISLALGYMGLYLQQRLVRRPNLARMVMFNTMLFVLLFSLTFWGLHVATMAAVLAFVSGMAVRVLQQTPLKAVWVLGTLIPIAAALLSAGRFLSATAEMPFWTVALTRWIGLTSACYFLTLLCNKYDGVIKTSMPERRLHHFPRSLSLLLLLF